MRDKRGDTAQPRPTVRLIVVSGHCNLCQNDRVGDRVGGTLKEGKGIEVECDSARETAQRERERVEEIWKGTREERCEESAKRGKMPTITPPSVPSRFQVRSRFMRLILALFLASASRQVSG